MNLKHQRQMGKGNKENRWEVQDWIFLIFTTLGPVVSFLSVLFFDDTKRIVTAVVAGISIPIVLIGWRQNKNKDLIKTTQSSIYKLEKSISVTEDLEKIFSKGEERRISFARRRLEDFNVVVRRAVSSTESELLSVPVYYSELNNLANILEKEKSSQKSEIWAMTGFSDEEWGDKVNDLEVQWGKRIKELSKKYKTKRICIIDGILAKLLKEEASFYDELQKDWDEHSATPSLFPQKRLKSFIDYLTTYFKSDEHKVKSYALNDTTQAYTKLIQEKGFFGIKLSDNKKYVIKGEAVNPATGLQGEYVFDEATINTLYELHYQACEKSKSFEEFLQSETSLGFKEFLRKNGIDLIKESSRK